MSIPERLSREGKRVDYCNLAAQALGLAPAGHARQFDDAVLLETPLPWRRDIYEQAGALPQEMIDLLALWSARYQQGQPYGHCPLLIAPDPAYAQPALRRVIYFARPAGTFARYTRTEYLAPEAEAGPLLWALHEAPAELARFAQYRVTSESVEEPVRDMLVCTHGTVDAACSKFGYPLYAHLRRHCASESVRVWRVSHFGGHVFAPTMLEFPTGAYWAYVGAGEGEQIVARSGDVAHLHGLYRGWAGAADGFAQVADGMAWQQEGWPWFDYVRACTVTAVDQEHSAPQWMEVRVDFVRPDGTSGAYWARVEAQTPISTRTETAHASLYAYPQYGIAAWRRL